MILIQPGDAIPGEEPLAYTSHGKEKWPEVFDFLEASGVRPRKISGPDNFDTVAARQSGAPKDQALVLEQRRDTEFPDMLHPPDFFRSGPESLSSDSTAFSEMAHVSHLTAGMESQTSESLQATPVPEMTSLHPLNDKLEQETEQDFEQSLLSLFNEPPEQKFESQPLSRATQRFEQRRPEVASHKRKPASGAEGARKRRSMAGSDERDRRRNMMTRSQGHSFYSSRKE